MVYIRSITCVLNDVNMPDCLADFYRTHRIFRFYFEVSISRSDTLYGVHQSKRALCYHFVNKNNLFCKSHNELIPFYFYWLLLSPLSLDDIQQIHAFYDWTIEFISRWNSIWKMSLNFRRKHISMRLPNYSGRPLFILHSCNRLIETN